MSTSLTFSNVDVAKAVKTIESVIRTRVDRVSVLEMLCICQNAGPAKICKF